jgi:hypothetical protein
LTSSSRELGDHTTLGAKRSCSSLLTLPVSMSTTSSRPPRRWNAIRFPSGDQPKIAPTPCRTSVLLAPPCGRTRRSAFDRQYAIVPPSGDQSGVKPFGTSCRRWLPSADAVQIPFVRPESSP